MSENLYIYTLYKKILANLNEKFFVLRFRKMIDINLVSYVAFIYKFQ